MESGGIHESAIDLQEESDKLSESFARRGSSENELKVRRHKVAVLRWPPLARGMRRCLLFGSGWTYHQRPYPMSGAFGRAETFVDVLDHVF
ncbi:unnamed protein product [Sphenostylis stenocarpa]|uniref:Uncharacterized protein n=1 Tax=Sphenostylis stenocarpa TaxID=92480 RepID=A0AA86SU27_9FABA|nr:unnamed protein product [Sphenostylis stenocarpa]